MLAIGRALMARPRVLLLDEPSMGLAPIIVEDIFATLRQLRDQGISILLVEQNARAALRFSDRAYVLTNGRVEMERTTRDRGRLCRTPIQTEHRRTITDCGSAIKHLTCSAAFHRRVGQHGTADASPLGHDIGHPDRGMGNPWRRTPHVHDLPQSRIWSTIRPSWPRNRPSP